MTPPELEIDAALECAGAFLRSAEVAFPDIDDFREVSGIVKFSPVMGDVVVAASNLAFAIELYLKATIYKTNVAFPSGRDGHRLAGLFKLLPVSYKSMFEDTDEEKRKMRWNGQYPSVTISLGQLSNTQPRPSTALGTDFSIAALFKRSDELFVSWRYIFEIRSKSSGLWQSKEFEYALLFCACWAISDFIDSLRK